MSTEQRWVLIAGAGEFRGEGTWVKIEEAWDNHSRELNWKYCLDTGYLPVFVGKEPPEEADG